MARPRLFHSLLAAFAICLVIVPEASPAEGAGASCQDKFAELVNPLLGWIRNFKPPAEGTISSTAIVPNLGSVGNLRNYLRATGKSLEEALEELEIPPSLRKFYAADGRFSYRPLQSRLLSVENGDQKLQAIKIHYEATDIKFVFDELVSDYIRVLKKMPDLNLLVVVKPKDRAEFLKLIDFEPQSVKRRILMVDVDSKHPLTPWSQDGAKPLDRAAGEPLRALLPNVDLQDPYRPTWDSLRRRIATQDSPFYFAGGNVIVGDRNTFVGPEIIDLMVGRLAISRAEAREALSREFGRPVIEIKAMRTPVDSRRGLYRPLDFHVDMFMAVARDHKTGRETVLLQSPELAMKLLLGGRDARKMPSDWTEFCTELVRGAAAEPGGRLNLAERDLMVALKAMSANTLQRQQDDVNAVARELLAQGYDVKWIPGIAQETSKRTVGELQIFSYANSIFSGTDAIVPRLGLPQLDQAVKETLEGMGYRTIGVRSPRKSYCLTGGIRCMSETYRVPIR